MNATELVFPAPAEIHEGSETLTPPKTFTLEGEKIPSWLKARLASALATAGAKLTRSAPSKIIIETQQLSEFSTIEDDELRGQAYNLEIDKDCNARIVAESPDGVRHGIITLCMLIEAAAAGASLKALRISDAPAFRIRGIQMDMAREFYPPMSYLKKTVDRMVDLKLNTLWLYLENHFRAPGMEDISPKAGMTPAQAREISEYGLERGIDVVPGTNLLSHMEGWFRLERYSEFCDGRMRSHPVLTREESMALSKQFATEMAKAFPSPNFHAGLDELLFTGTNPEAAEAIERKSKAIYFADFARELIDHITSLGKKVWMWDDMVLAKNIYRKEGFNEDYPKALELIPEDTIMTHWWYWERKDHEEMIERVVKSGRPFVVAPHSQACAWDFSNFYNAFGNQRYLAQSGLENGAFGYVCTHWESTSGNSFEANWPTLAMSAGQSWSGGAEADERFLRSLSFALTGDTDGALGEYLITFSGLSDFLKNDKELYGNAMRFFLINYGPQILWRRLSPKLDMEDRARIGDFRARAAEQYDRIGERDKELKEALKLFIVLLDEGLNIIEGFDNAWGLYHRAALAERNPGEREKFEKSVAGCIEQIRRVADAIDRYSDELQKLEDETGHSPYDSYVLKGYIGEMDRVEKLIRAVVKDDNGLPYFEKLLNLPNLYRVSNMKHMQWQNIFNSPGSELPWPVRWVDA